MRDLADGPSYLGQLFDLDDALVLGTEAGKAGLQLALAAVVPLDPVQDQEEEVEHQAADPQDGQGGGDQGLAKSGLQIRHVAHHRDLTDLQARGVGERQQGGVQHPAAVQGLLRGPALGGGPAQALGDGGGDLAQGAAQDHRRFRAPRAVTGRWGQQPALDQHQQIQPQGDVDLLGDVVDLLAKLQIADQGLAVVPGLDRAQGQGAQGTQFQALGLAPALLGQAGGGPVDRIPGQVRLVGAQHHPAVGIQHIEVGDPVLPVQTLEQGGDLGPQGVQIAGQKGRLEGGIAADRAEGGVELGRVVVELQAEQPLHGPHAVGQVVCPGMGLVAIGNG